MLRGGRAKTNYDAASIRAAEEKLSSEKLPPVLMVDCSHANSEKKFAKQEDVWRSVIQQRVGRHALAHRPDGREQHCTKATSRFRRILKDLRYGVSHHRFLHRLGNHRADAALGLRNAGKDGVVFSRGSRGNEALIGLRGRG